jgi:regulator of sirC expression with transglutaminase-like and TPR domain
MTLLPTSPETRRRQVEQFSRVVSGDQRNLFDAALCIAAPEYQHLPAEELGGMLDAMARAARAVVADAQDTSPTATLLAGVCQVMFQEGGFKGNTEDYGDPRNSFLNEVLARRVGLPISLSVVFVELARRAGLQAHGVAFPGHFLARVEDPDDDGAFVVVDSFAGGRILGVEDLRAMVLRVSQGRTQLTPSMLAPASTNLVLTRMLRNLRAVYTEQEDYDRALLAQERILVLNAQDATEHRDHGMLLARAMEPNAAIEALDRYLTRVPRAADAKEIRAFVARLRRDARTVQ